MNAARMAILLREVMGWPEHKLCNEHPCYWCKAAQAAIDEPDERVAGQLPVSDIITTKADIALCLGSGELLRCPFCGHYAISSGEKTKSGRGFLWTIQCTHTTHLCADCCASVWAVDDDQATARSKAVARWNRRVNKPEEK